MNFLYNQRRPSWRRQTCPRTSRPVIVRLGMMTVRKCQAVVVAGRWRNPRVKLMAIIVGSVSIDPLQVRAVQNVLVPLVGFHDGSPDDDGQSNKQNRFDDHVFNTFRPSIEDRPATVVNKIPGSTLSDSINGRCDIFAASARRLEQTERRGNDQRPF